MSEVLRLAEKLWSGASSTVDLHPFTTLCGLGEVADGVGFVSSFANVTAVRTDDGLVLVDTGSFLLAMQVYMQIREWSDAPVKSAVYTHGHVDHVFGLKPFEEEASDKGWDRPIVLAHENVAARFDRYKLTRGYNQTVNRRQFQMADLQWPKDYRYPDETFRTQQTFDVGGVSFEVYHDKGETDDHAWVWIPSRKVLCTGDLFIWASPNCGNPQKAKRYPREWAAALRKMAALQPELLLPGHGPPIVGADRVQLALGETAELLETIVEQTLALMNDGARLDDVLRSVKVPDRLLERPYLRPIYDEPEFIVRNLWRHYGGWYDGNPAHLKPARDVVIARQIADLSGGARRLADRAAELSAAGDHAVACHLAEMAAQAAPDDGGIRTIRQGVYRKRAGAEMSLMAKGVYSAAAEE